MTNKELAIQIIAEQISKFGAFTESGANARAEEIYNELQSNNLVAPDAQLSTALDDQRTKILHETVSAMASESLDELFLGGDLG